MPRKSCHAGIGKIGCEQRGLAVMPLFHQLEEDVGLLGFNIEISKLVDREDVDVGERASAACAWSDRRSEEYISSNRSCALMKQCAIAVLHGLQHQRAHQSGLADAGFTDKDNILCFGDELQLRKGADLALLDAGLQLEGEAFPASTAPAAGPASCVRRAPPVAGLPLDAQQLREHRCDRRAVALGRGEQLRQRAGEGFQFRLSSSCCSSSFIIIRPPGGSSKGTTK